MSEGFTALSNTITCHTVSSVDGSPALIIFPFSISSLELTLNCILFFLQFFWVSVNQRYHPAESFQETYMLDKFFLNTVVVAIPKSRFDNHKVASQSCAFKQTYRGVVQTHSAVFLLCLYGLKAKHKVMFVLYT